MPFYFELILKTKLEGFDDEVNENIKTGEKLAITIRYNGGTTLTVKRMISNGRKVLKQLFPCG